MDTSGGQSLDWLGLFWSSLGSGVNAGLNEGRIRHAQPRQSYKYFSRGFLHTNLCMHESAIYVARFIEGLLA